MERKLEQYLPYVVRNYTEFQGITQSEQPEFEQVWTDAVNLWNNQFISTAKEIGLSRWERMLKLRASPSDTLDERRFRIRNRLSTYSPFTLPMLYQKLDEIIGEGKWRCDVDYEHYTISVESSLENQFYAIEAAYTLNEMIPLNMVYKNTPLLIGGVSVTEETARLKRIYHYGLGMWQLGRTSFATDEPYRDYRSKLGEIVLGVTPFASGSNRNYQYKLGEFKLGESTFAQSIPGEVVKMGNTPSIQPEFLAKAANFMVSDITKARLNGEIVITTLEKMVSGTTAIVKYLVPDGMEVNKVELLDEEGMVLTTARVYVPSGVSTVLKHEIPVKEGCK